MSFIKQTLKNTASLVLAVWIIGTAYAAITTVNSGDPLTASSWNEMVTRLTSNDTNSTDLVTKAYVDSSVSASSWSPSWSIDWNDCSYDWFSTTSNSNTTLTCPANKVLVDHSCGSFGSNWWICKLNWINSLYINWSTTNTYAGVMGSIKCCKVNP